jgi:5-formyltetrahydrofolate cyclo-ligase
MSKIVAVGWAPPTVDVRSMIAALKKEIRREVLRKRDNLYLQDRINLSKEIFDNLLSLEEFSKAKVIHFFLTTKSEVLTEDAIRRSLSLGKSVVVPVTEKGHKRIFLSGLEDYDKELTLTPHGILEPKREFRRHVALHDVDLMILPGVAFDTAGHRIGYGAGYYDRLLEETDMRPFLIAPAFELQIVDNIPVGSHDIRVDKIITEKRVIEIPSPLVGEG